MKRKESAKNNNLENKTLIPPDLISDSTLATVPASIASACSDRLAFLGISKVGLTRRQILAVIKANGRSINCTFSWSVITPDSEYAAAENSRPNRLAM